MKKLFSLLLVVALVAIMATGAYAASASSYVSVSNSTPVIGDTISVPAGISNNPGFASGKVTFSYDSSVLRLDSITNGLFAGETNPDTGMANHYGGGDPVTGDGVLCTANFTVIGSGDTTVSVSVSGMRDNDGNLIEVSGSSASVSVSVAAPHEHSFGDEWKFDENGHWHKCECGAESDVEEHDMVDGVCSVCGYEEEVVVPTEKPADPEPTKKPADPEPTEKPVDPSKSPQTGDFTAFVLIAVVCAAAVVVIVSSKKSKAQK